MFLPLVLCSVDMSVFGVRIGSASFRRTMLVAECLIYLLSSLSAASAETSRPKRRKYSRNTELVRVLYRLTAFSFSRGLLYQTAVTTASMCGI